MISRWEENRIKETSGWVLVYGRRKVGKTFLLRRFIDWDSYITITRTREAIVQENENVERVQLDEAVKSAVDRLRKGEVVVVDEFQRLGEWAWDMLAVAHPNGRLIISGSSLGIINKVFSRKSPLLGLLTPIRLDIISYSDSVSSLYDQGIKLRDALIWGTIIRDPWVIPFVNLGNEAVDEISRISYQLVMSASGLVGEVFEDEERSLTELYDAVLRLVGEGIWNSAEIADLLIARGLIKGGLATVTGILDRLVRMGLLEKVPLWKTRRARYYYKHRSPLLSMLYYIDQKYSISEGEASISNLRDGILSILSKEIQFCIGELLAERLGGVRSYTILPSGLGDIDVVILDARRKVPIAAYEVKLGSITVRDARKAVERMRSLGFPRVGVISLSELPPKVKGVDEVLGPEELIKLANKLRYRRSSAIKT